MSENADLTERLFIGIPLPEDVRKKLKTQSWSGLERYKAESLVPSFNWHLTMAFIGQINQDLYTPLIQLLEVYDWGSGFKASIRHFGGFPEMDSAKIIWAGLNKGNKEVEDLAEILRRQLNHITVPYDQKPFVPHITLCRMRSQKNISRLQEDGKMKQEIPFHVDKMILYKSIKGKHPYVPILEVPLS
jgi:RNA 2',3'-cyclic 3'-phosphodiesterase